MHNAMVPTECWLCRSDFSPVGEVIEKDPFMVQFMSQMVEVTLTD